MFVIAAVILSMLLMACELDPEIPGISATSSSDAFTVTFDSNGGSAVAAQDVAEGETVSEPDPAPTRVGHTFGGWLIGATAYDFSTSVTGNLTLTAEWTPNDYDVVFNANGGTGTMASQSITFGTSANLSANTFTRDGYTFAGWNTASGGGGASYGDTASFAMTVEGITFYAQWVDASIEVFTVTFDSNGGSSVSAQDVADGDTVPEPDPAPTRLGHSFGGWFNGATAYDFGTPVTGALTLTAAWTANSYDVVFNANGGSGSMAAQSITFGTSANLSANTFTRDGYTFAGWNTESGGGGTAYGNTANFPMNVEGVTLYAQWEAVPLETFTVTFNSNGGSAVSAQDVVEGETVSVPDPVPTRLGHSFDGWFNGATAYDFGMPVTGNLTLTAEWTPNDYDVVFDANGGTGSMVSQSITFGTSANLTANSFARDGHTFAGWTTASGGGGTAYDDEASFIMEMEGITLYAQWEESGEIVYAVGDTGPAGGTIFFVDTLGEHDGWTYLEAAPADYSGTSMISLIDDGEYQEFSVTGVLRWGHPHSVHPSNSTLVEASGTAIGTGLENTYAAGGIAGNLSAIYWAEFVYELLHDGTGFADWFLPSRDELSLMYTELELSGSYWSSSETSATSAYWVDNSGALSGNKTGTLKVRAARRF